MRIPFIALVALAASLALAKPPPGTAAPPANAGEHFADVDVLLHALQSTNRLPAAAAHPTVSPPAKAALPQTAASTNAKSAASATNAAPLSLTGYVPDDKYNLRVGDRISLQILEDRDPPKSLVITDSGELDAPYVGRVAASDKTCKQLADELKTLLEKDYYYRATVIIAVDAFNKILGRI